MGSGLSSLSALSCPPRLPPCTFCFYRFLKKAGNPHSAMEYGICWFTGTGELWLVLLPPGLCKEKTPDKNSGSPGGGGVPPNSPPPQQPPLGPPPLPHPLNENSVGGLCASPARTHAPPLHHRRPPANAWRTTLCRSPGTRAAPAMPWGTCRCRARPGRPRRTGCGATAAGYCPRAAGGSTRP